MASIYSMKQPGMSIYGINMHAGDLAPAQQQSGVQDGAVVVVQNMQLSAGVWYIELLTGMLDWHATLAGTVRVAFDMQHFCPQ